MHSSDPTFPLFPLLSFFAVIANSILFPWHLMNRKIATCGFMFSAGFYSFIGFTNSLTWTDNADNVAPGWCELTAPIIAGTTIGIIASTFAMIFQLLQAVARGGPPKSPQEKRQDIIIQTVIVFALPFLGMILRVAVQPTHRFDIWENVGCQPAVLHTIGAYLIFTCWSSPIAACAWFCLFLMIYWLYRDSGMSENSCIPVIGAVYCDLRLTFFVFVILFCGTPIGIFSTIVAVRNGLNPPPLLLEADYLRIGSSPVLQVPASLWRSDPLERAFIEVNRWVPIFCSFVFFAFFGFTEETKKNYYYVLYGFFKKSGNVATEPRFSTCSPRTSRTSPTHIELQPTADGRPLNLESQARGGTSYSTASSSRPSNSAKPKHSNKYAPRSGPRAPPQFYNIELNQEV